MTLARAKTLVAQTADLLLPANRNTPAELAAMYLHDGSRLWDAELSCDMVEPMNTLADRRYRQLVFLGPARSSKSWSLMCGGINYALMAAPGETLVAAMTMDVAKTVSTKDIGKAIEHSPEWRRRLRDGNTSDSVKEKHFDRMSVMVGWPSSSQLSGVTMTYVFMPDYDNAPNAHNVDGKGPMFDMGATRTRIALSRGKAVAEGNPATEFLEPNWVPSSPHEAPPVVGLCSIYNRGTKARRYWPCPHCDRFYQAEPGYGLFKLGPLKELSERIRGVNLMTFADDHAVIYCPHCGAGATMDHRAAMRRNAVWMHEGQRINEHGEVIGERIRSPMASYWLGGVSAAFHPWPAMLLDYLQAVDEWRKTSSEALLRKVTNTDAAAPYVPVNAMLRRRAQDLKDRAESWDRGTVPLGVRFLVAAVDTQSGSWMVHVFGYGIGLECWVIDRFKVYESKRFETINGVQRPLMVHPAAYVEDWNLLIEQVAKKTYPLIENPGVTMTPRLTLVDSGGSEGVTARAYEAWRTWKNGGYGARIMLCKGHADLKKPRVEESWPEATRREDRSSGAMGDVPVWMLNVNMFKDALLNGDLAKTEDGPGYIHLPNWAEQTLFDELVAEQRNDKGIWEKQQRRNEATDLQVYGRAACLILQAEAINWARPPAWAIRPTVAPEVPKPTAAQAQAPRTSSVIVHGRRR